MVSSNGVAVISASSPDGFREYCLTDLQLNPKMAKNHVYRLDKFLRRVGKPVQEVTPADVRGFLSELKG